MSCTTLASHAQNGLEAQLARSLSLQDVAESVGIANLPDEVATALAGDVEYRLWEIIEVRLAPLPAKPSRRKAHRRFSLPCAGVNQVHATLSPYTT